MPKGVEHSFGGVVSNAVKSVKIPLMPKGVEHPSKAAARSWPMRVKIPLMPKGVEHKLMAQLTPDARACEDSIDAERR